MSWEDVTCHDKTAALVGYDQSTKRQLPRDRVKHCHVAKPLRSQVIGRFVDFLDFIEYCEIKALTENPRVSFRSENTSIRGCDMTTSRSAVT